MKKIFYIMLLIIMCPLFVFGETTKDGVDEIINTIENVQVDDTVIIEKVVKNDNLINFRLNINGIINNGEISYNEDNNMIEFTGGRVLLSNNNGVLSTNIENNELAFYLYSIIENKIGTEYDINNYYNSSNIDNKLVNIDTNLYQKIINGELNKLEYVDSSNTYGLILDVVSMDNNNILFQIKYSVLFGNNNDTINNSDNSNNNVVSMREMSDFKNPETGSMNTYITMMFLFVVGLLGYTLISGEKNSGGI